MGCKCRLVAICALSALLPVPATAQAGALPPVPLLRCQEPKPTEEALIAHLAGVVTMSLTIDEEGRPSDIHVVNPLGLGLDESAVACMAQSRYSPARKDGKSVPLKTSLSVGFPQGGNSDWHLGKVVFHTPEGASRPAFLQSKFPAASGSKRTGTVCVRLVVNRDGVPCDIQVTTPHDPAFDRQAILIAQAYRFKPATRNGAPVEVSATLNLVHGRPGK